MVCTIQSIWEQQLYTQPLWWTMQQKTACELTNNQRRSEKMTSNRSALSVNPTPREISIKKPNKTKQRRSKIPNLKLMSVFEIPEDSLNCRPM
jgi:antirestriction protein ArdC